MQPYTEDYYADLMEGTRSSAGVIVPLVMELVNPKSVVDVGCGTGSWLSVFNEQGIEDILGVDGEWVNKTTLEIPEERFVSSDLEHSFSAGRRFDLVVSLEVAEHLPSERADIFVNTLTGLGSVVLFSAAVPYQVGENHVNGQWPEYWMELFRSKGFVAIDCFRRSVWCDEKVEPWYAQNILLYAEQRYLNNQPTLKKAYELYGTSQLAVVHPKLYLLTVESVKRENSSRHRFLRIAKRMIPSTAQRVMRAVRGRVCLRTFRA